MRHVPWITLAATVVFFLIPLGRDLLHQAFVSGEQLSNSIAQFMLLVILGIVIALALLEWGVKFLIRQRRTRA
jgi:hypothetical protein